MRFQYAEKKVSLPENVHRYAEKKVMKLERFFGDDADALVTFSVEKNRNNVEITVHAANTYFRASESTSDMFAVGGRGGRHDRAADPQEQDASRQKTPSGRLRPHTRHHLVRSGGAGGGCVRDHPDEEVQHEAHDPREEAILQMNLLEHSFFAFRDEDSGRSIAVVYRRTDGGYGLIEDVE